MIFLGDDSPPRPYDFLESRKGALISLGATLALGLGLGGLLKISVGEHLFGAHPDPEALTVRTLVAVMVLMAGFPVIGSGIMAWGLRRWPLPLGLGEASERRHPEAGTPEHWAPTLDPDEEPLAATLVDEPDRTRPLMGVALSLGLLLAGTLLAVVATTALAATGHPALEYSLGMGFVVLPLASLLLVVLNPGDVMLLVPGIGLGAMAWVVLGTALPDAVGVLLGDPLVWVAVLAWLAGAAWAVAGYLGRARRWLLVTSRGVRLVEERPGGPVSLRGPFAANTLRRSAGWEGPAWILAPTEAGTLRVFPTTDDAEGFATACGRAGLDLHVTGEGGPADPLTEARRLGDRLLVPALAAAVVLAGFGPPLRLALHVGLGLVPYMDASTQDPAAADALLAASQKVLAVIPGEPTSLLCQSMIASSRGDDAAALEALQRAEVQFESLRWPELVQGSLRRLVANCRAQRDAGCPPPLPEAGRHRGWEPEGPARPIFRRAIWAATSYETRLWGAEWQDWIRDAREARRLAPREPGPALLLFWMATQAEYPWEDTVWTQLLGEGRPKAIWRATEGDPASWLAAVRQNRAARLELLAAAEATETWRGVRERFARSAPVALASAVLDHAGQTLRDGGSLQDLVPLREELLTMEWLGLPWEVTIQGPDGPTPCLAPGHLPPMYGTLVDPPVNLTDYRHAFHPPRAEGRADVALLRQVLDALEGGVVPEALAAKLRARGDRAG